MKKYLLLLLSLFICSSVVNAEIAGSRFKITESQEEFDVAYYVTDDMTVIGAKENDDVAITNSFTIKKNNLSGEVRYSLFTDTGDGDDEDINAQYAMWVFMCLNNIAGYEVDGSNISVFNDDDVKKEFNGDFGCTTFIMDPKSQYGEGYKYMDVEFFYRKGQGLVMRAFLFNDVAFLGLNRDGTMSQDSPLFQNYHTFRFMEKDSDGNFISE